MSSNRVRRIPESKRASAARTRAAMPARRARQVAYFGKRVRGGDYVSRDSYNPPETWHEPTGKRRVRTVMQPAGQGYRHVLTPSEVRSRLAQLPQEFLAGLEVVQFSQMTRKKLGFPCYGMQWGPTIYLYPIEVELVEHFYRQPRPAQLNEARQFGGVWERVRNDHWLLRWTEAAIKDFYLNNILIHELGHLVDQRNSSYVDRERYAEWFALEFGYKPTRRSPWAQATQAELRQSFGARHARKG